MHLLKLSVPLAILALAAAACDGDNTPGVAASAGDSANNPNAGIATQPAGNTATQPAPNTATQTAPNTATQTAPNTATQPAGNTASQPAGSGIAMWYCMSVCNHVMALGCSDSEDGEDDTDCAANCAAMQTLTTCQAEIKSLLACIGAATSCSSLISCKAASEAFTACAEGGSVTPTPTPTPTTTPTTTPPPTTGTPTISDTANCNTASTCTGCETTCDICVCGVQLSGSSAAACVSSGACSSS